MNRNGRVHEFITLRIASPFLVAIEIAAYWLQEFNGALGKDTKHHHPFFFDQVFAEDSHQRFSPHARIQSSRKPMSSPEGLSQFCADVNLCFGRTSMVRPRPFKTRKASSSVASSPRYATGRSVSRSFRRDRSALPLLAERKRSSMPSSNSAITRSARWVR